MAGRPGSNEIEGRSETVEVRYDGPDSPGQLHILALGVSKYRPTRPRSLQFADRDARATRRLPPRSSGRAIWGVPGLRIVLTNREVTEAKVNEAFVRIRDRVKGRPEDTVVVFLAGHADALAAASTCSSPNFPFPDLDARTGHPERIRSPSEIDQDTVLPYVALYRNIARLNALQRLVVDRRLPGGGDRRRSRGASDPGTDRQRRPASQDRLPDGRPSGRARRRGAALKHGLMTYALLKGMGEPDLEESVPGLTSSTICPTPTATATA